MSYRTLICQIIDGPHAGLTWRVNQTFCRWQGVAYPHKGVMVWYYRSHVASDGTWLYYVDWSTMPTLRQRIAYFFRKL